MKLPKDKPAFIGVVFENISLAGRLNSHLPEQHKTEQYKLIIEPIARKVNLRLVCESIGFNYQYMGLDYDYDKLKNWLNFVQPNSVLNFSHLIREYDKEKVVFSSPNRSLFVLKINGYMLI